MFNKAKETSSSDSGASFAPPPKRTAMKSKAPSILSSDLVLTGSIVSDGEIQLDGQVDGDVLDRVDRHLWQPQIHHDDANFFGDQLAHDGAAEHSRTTCDDDNLMLLVGSSERHEHLRISVRTEWPCAWRA